MANIDISKAHSLPLDEAKKKAEELAKSMESRLGLTWEVGRRHDSLRGAERHRQGYQGRSCRDRQGRPRDGRPAFHAARDERYN